MSETSRCPQCGKPVPESAPGGLCPECMLKVGAAAPTEEIGPQGTRVINTSPRESASVDEIAKLFPHLEILKCLGRGGMGVVYRARQPKLDRFVALKLLAPEREGDPKFADRFKREARALARLSHPNIVAVHDFGETNGLFYLIMEFVDGANLRRLIQDRKIEPEEALAIVPRICEALQYAHGKGIVHRDIKPENVLLDRDGQVKIADFGIAKMLGQEKGQPSITEDGTVGTPHYMAPEQVEQPQRVDHRADIYSLGVVFYEMLTGELPLGKFAPPSRKVQVDVRLDEVVLHALEKEPERRYQHVGQIKTDVETIAGSTPEVASCRRERAFKPTLGWRDRWLWQRQVLVFGFVPFAAIALLMPLWVSMWGEYAAWLLIVAVSGMATAGIHAWIGHRIHQLESALPPSTAEVAHAWITWEGIPWPLNQSQGLAVLHANRLELVRVWQRERITVRLSEIVSAQTHRWPLIWKRSLELRLTSGERLHVAVPKPFAERWHSRLNSANGSSGMAADRESAEQSAPTSAAPPWCSAKQAEVEPSFSRPAIIGAVWIGLFFLNWLVSYTPPGWALTKLFRGSPLNLAAELLLFLPLMVLGFAAVVGGSVMGGVALRQIRQVRGAVRGFGLALFDLFLFPLLLLNGWGAWLAWQVLSQAGMANNAWVFVGLCVGVGLNIWLIRILTRAAARFVQTPAPPEYSQPTGTWSQVVKGTLARLLLVIAAQLALFETIAQVSVHWKESTGELWEIGLAVATLGGLIWACWPGYQLKRSWVFCAGGAIVSSLFLLALDNFYFWHLRPNLGLYREPDWVARHPGFQKQMRERIESNLWKKAPSIVDSSPSGAAVEQVSSFCSVIESTLTPPQISGTNQPAWWLDLDGGKSIKVPATLVEFSPATMITKGMLKTDPKSVVAEQEGKIIRWMTSEGVDLACGIRRGRWGLLTQTESPLELIPVEAQNWNEADPDQVLQALDAGESNTWQGTAKSSFSVHTLAAEPSFPLSYAYRSQEGTAGLLQIIGFTAGKDGLRTRFKRIRVTNDSPGPADPSGASTGSSLSEAELEKLRIRLQAAEEQVEFHEMRYEAGLEPVDEMNAARAEADILKAQLEGDHIRVAQVRLEAAQRALELAQARFEAALVSSSIVEAARLEVRLREIDVQTATGR